MPLLKTLRSSLTAAELLVNKLCYRNKAKIKRHPPGGVLETSTQNPSPVTRLPQELVETIISYFIYDIHTLLACSMTCYSWYIAAVPHLHHSLTADDQMFFVGDKKYRWPDPLRNSYKLGLLPLVKRFRIRLRYYGPGFGINRLGRRTLRYFSAFTTLQELGIDYLQIPSFMPNIQQYFGHLSPTLQSLNLEKPKGSCQQILYFIGLFPNLQDLRLSYVIPDEEQENDDVGLVPLSVPPLQGKLILRFITRERLVKDMIVLFRGLHFHQMELFSVRHTQLLLGACAETLERLQLYPTDPYMNNLILLQHFNLSQNKSLQTLETTAESIVVAGNAASSSLITVLSTIRSPTFLNVVIIYQDCDFDRKESWPFGVSCRPGPAGSYVRLPEERAGYGPRHQHIFKVLHEIHGAQGSQLVLCVYVLYSMVERAVGMLECLVKAEKMKGRVDYLLHRPLIITKIKAPHTCLRPDLTSTL